LTRLTWLGHSTVVLDIGGQRLLTDPVLGDRIGPVTRRSQRAEIDVDSIDAVLVSHLHHDHLHLPSLGRLRDDIRLIVPRGAGPLLRSEGFGNVVELDVSDATTVGAVVVRAVPAMHDSRRHPFGPSAPALGFLIDGEQRIYFAGDTDLFPGMAELGLGLDLAILPVGGWGPTLRGGHMDPVRAATALTLLQPRMAVAIHWGTLWPMGMGRVRRDRFAEPARRFLEAARTIAPSVSIIELEPGGQVELGSAYRDAAPLTSS
jgi:L-ascorbate metabolism protein UlaG (beta-lactamase superfamily)